MISLGELRQKGKAMTSRIVSVVSIDDCGQGWDDVSVFDITPDHRVYHLKGVNCSTEEFAEWFSIVDSDYEFIVGGTACEELIDLGGATTKLCIGMLLEITFEQYFNARLELEIHRANQQLNSYIANAADRLGLVVDIQ